jgi:site-specific recombinase
MPGGLTPQDRRLAAAGFFAWLLEAGSPEGVAARCRAAAGVLDETPDLAARYDRVMEELLLTLDLLPLLTDAGVPGARGMAAELGTRLLRKLLPGAGYEDPAMDLAARVFCSPSAVARLRTLDVPALGLLAVLLRLVPDSAAPARMSGLLGEALRQLAQRSEVLSRERGIRTLLPAATPEESPFSRLTAAGEFLASTVRGSGDTAGAAEVWRVGADRVRSALAAMHDRHASGGVSLNTVYALVIMERSLDRMEAIVRVLAAPDREHTLAAVQDLLVLVSTSVVEDRRVRDLLKWNFRLLDMKIVERSGKTGEHYVARSREEYRHIWSAAAWGGLLTTVTAAVKLTITSLGLPLFQEGMLAGLNYAVSFLLLQRFGWMLATKQPAMTAAAMAAIVREHRGEDRIRALTDYATNISRSQLLAAVGNILLVTAGAFLVDLTWTLVVGRSFLGPEKADVVLTTLNPFLSLTAFYAALTGVILWLASLAGGWFENISVSVRVPQAIAAHPAGRVLGAARMSRFAASWRTNIAGWATNVSLGFMLGLAPVVGAFLGLPLDVRHVTLSTGMFAFAGASVEYHLLTIGSLLSALAGIGLMFTLNLSVSFILSLGNAVFAYGISGDELAEILRSIAVRFLRRPRDFLLPPRPGAGGD